MPPPPPQYFGIVPDSDSSPKESGPSPKPKEPTRVTTRPLPIDSKEVAVARVAAGRRGNPFQRDGRDRAVNDRPDVYEAILLAPGENKIDVEIDTRLPSAAIFTFHREDHTLGNMLTSRLLKTKHVIFAAYRVPHPLTPDFMLRVQTDGQITPRAAVISTAQALIKDLGILAREFQREYELRKMANVAAQQQNGE